MFQEKSIGTHDGSFHADEVSACALLVLFKLADKDKIYRTRDSQILANCAYVCDVGGIYDPSQKKFDHHQIEYQGPLSSAGMVLKYLKEEKVIEEELYDYINRSLIMGVDAHDNGVAKMEVGYSSFSQVISNFLPIRHDALPQDFTQCFYQAVDFAIGHIDRLIKRFMYTKSCKKIVKDIMKQSKDVLIFTESIPWMENFFALGGEKHPAQFIIMPTGKYWKLRGIPPSLKERMNVRTPLPKNWAGLHDEDLQKSSGIAGAIFCHKGRFISIWKTKEDALQALEKILRKKL